MPRQVFKNQQNKKNIEKIGQKMEEEQLKNLTEQLQTFTSNLESFSKQHKEEI